MKNKSVRVTNGGKLDFIRTYIIKCTTIKDSSHKIGPIFLHDYCLFYQQISGKPVNL